MKNKGFTLIELLAVLIILSILGLLIIPSVTNSIRDYKATSYDNQISNIVAAAKVWGTDHIGDLPTNDGDSIDITLGTLIDNGYIDPVINPKTNTAFETSLVIRITKDSNHYEYHAVA